MKRWFKVVGVLMVALLAFTGCNKVNTPPETVLGYYEQALQGNPDNLNNYLTQMPERLKRLLDGDGEVTIEALDSSVEAASTFTDAQSEEFNQLVLDTLAEATFTNGEIVIDEDTATFSVRVEGRDFTNAYIELMHSTREKMLNGETLTLESMNSDMINLMETHYQPVARPVEVTVILNKNDKGEWIIEDGSLDAILAASFSIGSEIE